VNVKGLTLGTRLAAERMARAGGGQVVNVGSLASLVPVPGLTVYSATKFAVRAFSLAAAVDLEPKGVHVSLVWPDLVDTPMLTAQLDREEAALSGARPLTADEVVDALLRVLETKEREVWLPARRGWLAKVGDLFPRVARLLEGRLLRQGRDRQAAMRAVRG
jgi:3-oxoacyl-[acyl-carrier protein] reductase